MSSVKVGSNEDNLTPSKSVQDDQIKWKYQDKAYNEAYKCWRKQKKNSIGFYYVDNPNELTYKDGVGFVKDYPEAVESITLRRVYRIVGIALLMLALIDAFQIYALPYLLNLLGADIYYDFYADKLYGNDWLIFVIHFVFEISKRVLAFIYCKKKLQMPLKIMLPTKVTNPALFGAAVPMMLFVSAIATVLSALYDKVLGAVYIEPVLWMNLPETKAPMVLTLIADVILIPCISEFCSRGAILQTFRQFGDGSAIIFTSLISAASVYNVNNFCYVFIVSMVIGYFTVRTGSIITAILMRISTRVFAYGIYLIDIGVNDRYNGTIIIAFIFLCTIIGLIVTIRFLVAYGDKFSMAMNSRYLSFSQKSISVFTCVPCVMWLTVTELITLLNISMKI